MGHKEGGLKSGGLRGSSGQEDLMWEVMLDLGLVHEGVRRSRMHPMLPCGEGWGDPKERHQMLWLGMRLFSCVYLPCRVS